MNKIFSIACAAVSINVACFYAGCGPSEGNGVLGTLSDAADAKPADGTAADGSSDSPSTTSGPECDATASCAIVELSCDDCRCVPVRADEPPPVCDGGQVACFANPCDGRAAACIDGRCAVVAAPDGGP